MTPALALLLSPGPAGAVPVSFRFEGAVVSLEDAHGLLGASGKPGAPFSLVTSFESATPDGEPDSAFGSYYNALPHGSLALTLGPFRWQSRDLLTVVADGAPSGAQPPSPPTYDGFRQEATFDTLAQGRHWGLFVQLFMLDETGAAFESTALPPMPTEPGAFGTVTQVLVTGGLVGQDGFFTLLASVRSASLAPAPGAGIAVTGTLAFVLLRRGRQRS